MQEVKELYGGYGRITILNGVSLSIPKASITTVIGPNGAGKSTVIKAIFGLLDVHSGQVLPEGQGRHQQEAARDDCRGRHLCPAGSQCRAAAFRLPQPRA
jgi:branched-chain amino acid transport system ATP-binding protein